MLGAFQSVLRSRPRLLNSRDGSRGSPLMSICFSNPTPRVEILFVHKRHFLLSRRPHGMRHWHGAVAVHVALTCPRSQTLAEPVGLCHVQTTAVELWTARTHMSDFLNRVTSEGTSNQPRRGLAAHRLCVHNRRRQQPSIRRRRVRSGAPLVLACGPQGSNLHMEHVCPHHTRPATNFEFWLLSHTVGLVSPRIDHLRHRRMPIFCSA